MIVRCIDDRKSRNIIEVGLDYEAIELDKNSYRLLLTEEYRKERGLSNRYQNTRFSKDRFVVIKE